MKKLSFYFLLIEFLVFTAALTATTSWVEEIVQVSPDFLISSEISAFFIGMVALFFYVYAVAISIVGDFYLFWATAIPASIGLPIAIWSMVEASTSEPVLVTSIVTMLLGIAGARLRVNSIVAKVLPVAFSLLFLSTSRYAVAGILNAFIGGYLLSLPLLGKGVHPKMESLPMEIG